MEPRNLNDLVHKFLVDPHVSKNRKSMTQTACGYAAKALGSGSNIDVPVHKIFTAQKALGPYLESTQLSPRSRRNYQSFFSRFITWCQALNLLPRRLERNLSSEWLAITHPLKGATSGRKGWRDALRNLGFWSSGYGILPAGLNKENLEAYAEFLEHESGVGAWRQIYNRADKEWQRHSKQGRVPSLSWPQLPSNSRSKYALMLHEWPLQMQLEYDEYREWCTKKFSIDRNPRYRQRKVSADQALSCLQRIAGFATNIYGMDKAALTMDIFFCKTIMTAYFEWMIDERLGGKPTGTLERLAAQLIGMARGYFDRPEALDWLLPLKMQVESEPIKNKRAMLLSMEQLEKVADGIRSLRLSILEKAKKGNREASALKQAQLVRAELVFRLLICRPLRQKNIREIQIDKQLIELDSNKFYLKFESKEMKNRYAFELPFPDDLVPLLKEYLTNYRSTLCNGLENNYLFPNPNGGHICDKTVQTIVGRHAMRVLGKQLNPHLVRDCVAHWLIRQSSDNVVMVSRLLGHRDIRTTINIYCNIEPVDAAEYYDALRLGKGAKDHDGSRK